MLRKVINLKEGLKLTCRARARSVGAREIVGAAAGSDAGRVGGERGERSAWRRSDDESGRAGRAQRTREAGGDVRVRFGAGWNVLGRPGRLWAGLDRSGAPWAGLDRSGPVQTVWTGFRLAGRSRRSGPDGIGPDWTGLDRVRLGSDLVRPGLVPSGRPGLVWAARSGSGWFGRSWAIRVNRANRANRLSAGGGWDDSRWVNSAGTVHFFFPRLGFLCGDLGGARRGESWRRFRSGGGFAGRRTGGGGGRRWRRLSWRGGARNLTGRSWRRAGGWRRLRSNGTSAAAGRRGRGGKSWRRRCAVAAVPGDRWGGGNRGEDEEWRRRPGGSPEMEVEEEIGGLGSVEGEGRRNRRLVDGRRWRLDGSPEKKMEVEWEMEEMVRGGGRMVVGQRSGGGDGNGGLRRRQRRRRLESCTKEISGQGRRRRRPRRRARRRHY